jgi:reactive intermediate/imine deaminase
MPRIDARLAVSTLCIGALTLGACAHRQVTHLPPTRDGAPYSRAVRVGDTLYLSGDGVIDPETGEPYDDPVVEAHELMQSLQATLAVEDMTLDDLVSVTVYCSDLSLYETFNEVYRSYFTGPMPARAFIGSGDLLWGMRFEIQGIAVDQGR